MANYSLTNGSTTGAGTLVVTAGSTFGACQPLCSGSSTAIFTRGRVFDVLVGTNTTPADNYVEWQISAATAISTNVGLGTAVAPSALDQADRAAQSRCTTNSTGSATVAAQNLWFVGMNQRASYRWVAAPGSELVWPQAASNGLALQARAGAASIGVTATWIFSE